MVKIIRSGEVCQKFVVFTDIAVTTSRKKYPFKYRGLDFIRVEFRKRLNVTPISKIR